MSSDLDAPVTKRELREMLSAYATRTELHDGLAAMQAELAALSRDCAALRQESTSLRTDVAGAIADVQLEIERASSLVRSAEYQLSPRAPKGPRRR